MANYTPAKDRPVCVKCGGTSANGPSYHWGDIARLEVK